MLTKNMSLKQKNNKFINDHKPMIFTRRKINFYWILAVLRIVLTFIPQTGYIHPDEFFQSIEVISGDHFDIDVYKPWEFNVTFPIRTAFIPQLTVGLPYAVLKRLSLYTFYFFGLSLRTPYFFVLFPRLFMCALSFISDYFLYKICQLYGQNYKATLITYASSYVMLTYATRTLSNSIELVLTAALLYFVCHSMAYSEKVILQSNYLLKKYSEAKTGVERVKYYKLKSLLPSHSLNHCMIIATITVIGIFNRPTFLAFAFAPIFFWLQRGLGTKSVNFKDFHIRILALMLCGVPVVCFLILIDSFYFGYLTTGEIGQLEIGINSFVVTPVNFLKHNANIKNLEVHGLHPWFLHLFVNIPLLFNVLGIIGLVTFAKMVYNGLRARWLQLPRLQSIVSLMTTTFIFPIILLSLFPHQEPRFIIPILFPLTFLYASELNQAPSLDLMKKFSNNNNDNQDYVSSSALRKPKKIKRTRKLIYFWYISNFLLSFFYGFLHQGGILSLTSHIAAELKTKPHLTHVHLYTSYSYPLSTALLHLRNTHRIYQNNDGQKYKLTREFYLHEQGSKPLPQVLDAIYRKFNNCEEKFTTRRIPYRLYYALPAPAMGEFVQLANNKSHLFNFHVTKTFYPHVSVEKLPSLPLLKELINFSKLQNKGIFSDSIELAKDIAKYMGQFKLLLLKIERFVPQTDKNVAYKEIKRKRKIMDSKYIS